MYIGLEMAQQPLLIHKTKCDKPVLTRRFPSTAKAMKWLRDEGCKFSNNDLSALGDDMLELMTENYEYSIEVDPLPQKRRRSHG